MEGNGTEAPKPVKKAKTGKAEIMAFYTGGAKLHASTTHTKEELEGMLEAAMTNKVPFVKLDTTNDDATIEDDSLTLVLDKLLFYTVLAHLPKEEPSKIIMPNKGIVLP